MPALDSARAQVIRNWCERVLCGYWTHAGYLNWDTGLGFKRWHQGKKLGLSQAALLGMAVCASSRPTGRGPSTCSTARSSSSAAGRSARACRRRTSSACRRSTTTSPRPCSPPRGCRPTPPRPRCSGSAPSAGGAAAAVRLRPRRGPARRHHPRLQHGDRRRQPRRLPVRRRRAGAAVRRPAGRRGRRRRAPAGVLRGRRAQRARARSSPRPSAPTATTRRCSCSRRRKDSRIRPTAGSFSTLRARGKTSRSGIDITTTHRSGRPTSRPPGTSTAPPGSRGGAVPELGQGARVWAVSARVSGRR